MNRCKTCKWWTLEGIESDYYEDVLSPKEPDTGELMKMPFEVRICHSPKLTAIERPVESSGCSAIDCSQYHAILVTGEDFGCINYDPSCR